MTLVVKALDLQVARSGLVDRDAASAAGFEPVSALVATTTRAYYYPVLGVAKVLGEELR